MCAHTRTRGQANENGFALAYDNVSVLMYLLQCIVIRCHPMSSDVIRCHTQPIEIVSMLMNLYNCIQSDPAESPISKCSS